MYCQSVANLVHDVVNRNCPINLREMFVSVRHSHRYNTRSSAADKLYTQPARLNIQLNSFSRVGVRLWNSIPFSTRKSSKHTFKKKIKNSLFSMLQNEESYFGIERAIQIFPGYVS